MKNLIWQLTDFSTFRTTFLDEGSLPFYLSQTAEENDFFWWCRKLLSAGRFTLISNIGKLKRIPAVTYPAFLGVDRYTHRTHEGASDRYFNVFFFLNTAEKRKLEKCFLGCRVWAPKPVYRSPKQPEYVTTQCFAW